MPYFCIHCAAPQPSRRDALHHCPPPEPVREPRKVSPGKRKTLTCVICGETAEGYRKQLIAAGWKDTPPTIKCPAHVETRAPRSDAAGDRVPEMIAMRAAGEFLRTIGARFGISVERARRILQEHGAHTARIWPEAIRERIPAMRQMRADGATFEQIGAAHGMTATRAWQILEKQKRGKRR